MNTSMMMMTGAKKIVAATLVLLALLFCSDTVRAIFSSIV
jgi:hypothetical protein